MALAVSSPPSRSTIDGLHAYVRALRTRLWSKRALRIILRTLTAVAALLLTARLLAAFGAAGAADATLLLAGMTAAGGTVAAIRSRPSDAVAARAADRAFGLRERLGTALELARRESAGELAALQISDTGQALADRPPARAFGPLVPARELAVALAAVALTALVWLTVPDLSTLVRSPFAPQETAQVPPSPLESNGDLNENNVNDILASIEETRRRAQERQIDPAEAQRQLGQAEARLNAKIEASNRQQQNLQSLADQLRQTATAQDIAGAIDRGDYSQASDLLNQLARESDQLSPQARRELAQALERAAQQTQQNNGLRDAERRSSQAMSRGDYQEIDRSMRSLGDQLGMAGRDVVPQSELGRAQGRLDQARDELGLGQGQNGEGEGGMEARGGQPAAGGTQPGNMPGGSQPGDMPGQNRQGPGGPEAQPGQGGQQQQGVGNQRPGDLPQQENGGDRLGVGGKPVQIDATDSDGQLRPSDGQGEQRGSQISNARPATGVGVAQPTDPIDSPADFTSVAPDRRPAVRSYFTPNSP